MKNRFSPLPKRFERLRRPIVKDDYEYILYIRVFFPVGKVKTSNILIKSLQNFHCKMIKRIEYTMVQFFDLVSAQASPSFFQLDLPPAVL